MGHGARVGLVGLIEVTDRVVVDSRLYGLGREDAQRGGTRWPKGSGCREGHEGRNAVAPQPRFVLTNRRAIGGPRTRTTCPRSSGPRRERSTRRARGPGRTRP